MLRHGCIISWAVNDNINMINGLIMYYSANDSGDVIYINNSTLSLNINLWAL